MERWRGRVAIVTGASAGIGEGIARLLVEEGMRVVAVARRLDRLQALAEEMKGKKGEVHAVQGDVTKEEDVKRVVKWARDNLGGADVLVNNAGVGSNMLLAEVDATKLKRMLDVNVFGLCIFTREVIQDMRSRGVDDGHIFHIGSISGQRIIDCPGFYFYGGTKHMVRVLTEGLRRELRDAESKIRVTEISPGSVETEFMTANGAFSQAQSDEMFKTKPCLASKDIANSVLYALSVPANVQVHELTIQPVGQIC